MTKRQKRVRSIAERIRTSWGICRRQARQMAEEEVAKWEQTFSPAGLRAALPVGDPTMPHQGDLLVCPSSLDPSIPHQ